MALHLMQRQEPELCILAFLYLGTNWQMIKADQYGRTYETRGVSHCDLAIYIKKYLKAEEELWKLKYFTMQNIIFKQILYRKPKYFKISYLYN